MFNNYGFVAELMFSHQQLCIPLIIEVHPINNTKDNRFTKPAGGPKQCHSTLVPDSDLISSLLT